MNVTECYDLYNIVRELEVVLQIDGTDFEERNMDVVIQNVKKRIGRQYQIDLSEHKVNSPEFAIGSYRTAVINYIDNVARIHSRLCGYGQIMRFEAQSLLSLSSVNYLGFTQESLKITLVALKSREFTASAEKAVDAIKEKLGNINNCWEKRMFMIIVVARAIGLDEVVAAAAEILFIAAEK